MASKKVTSLLPRRVQLVKLLRAHGVRDVERLREDELEDTWEQLQRRGAVGTLRAAGSLVRGGSALPTSGGRTPDTTDGAPTQKAEAKEDAHIDPRFVEPPIFLPEGERTFLRLIAVDSTRLFLTWDLSQESREALDGPLWVRVEPLEETVAPFDETIEQEAGRWYVQAPAEGCAVIAHLLTGSRDAPRILAQSNVAVVPPSGPAAPGPLIFATLAPSVDRRALVGGALLHSDQELPEGVERQEHAELASALYEPHAEEADAPAASQMGVRS